MTVTNNIRDSVVFDNTEWKEIPLSNEEIIDLLNKQKNDAFLSYSWGVWVTAYARNNLLKNIIKFDNDLIYADTDSCKLLKGFNKNIIDDYNKSVQDKIEKVCNDLDLDIKQFKPKDKNGKEHLIGLFELDGEYKEFKTLGAKKYCYKNYDDTIHITVSGVPKNGAVALKNLDEFNDNFIFDYKYTNKLMISYNDNMENYKIRDYNGNDKIIKEKYGICLVPISYKLGIAEEYFNLISHESSKHSIFKE